MTESIKSVIVIGATGLVGRELLKQLNALQSCEKITAVVRHEDAELKKLAKVQQFIIDDFLLINDEDVHGYSHAFSCLGSTLKKAGSKQNFYNIDYEINAHFADLLQSSATHYLLISAMGANPQSRIFYNQVKGKLEQYIQSLTLTRVSIIRPSLLLGQRPEQRGLEDAAQKLYQKLSHLVPDRFKYKPVTAQQVASTLVDAAQNQTTAFEIYDNLRIHNFK